MIKYYKLFDLLNRKGMKKTDLLDIISSPTLAKLSKGEIIKTDIIDKICMKLDCQPSDIMEYVPNLEEEKKAIITFQKSNGMLVSVNIPIFKKQIEIPLKEPWEEFLTEEVYRELWEQYPLFHGAIPEEQFREILNTCVGMKRKNELVINEEKLLQLLKRYADKSKLKL